MKCDKHRENQNWFNFCPFFVGVLENTLWNKPMQTEYHIKTIRILLFINRFKCPRTKGCTNPTEQSILTRGKVRASRNTFSRKRQNQEKNILKLLKRFIGFRIQKHSIIIITKFKVVTSWTIALPKRGKKYIHIGMTITAH